MSEERKNKVISSFVTTVTMGIILLVLYFFGLYSQIPPPEAKRMVLVEFTSFDGGGGGGGGNGADYNMSGSANKDYSESPNIATQDVEDAPGLATNSNTKKQTSDKVVSLEPKSEPGATYKPGKGSGTGSGSGGGSDGGSGGGTGTGTGTGRGSGMGTGEGGGVGSGKGPGYGSGTRRFTNIPDVNINENGVVYVEVHINTQGNVINARILSTPEHPTNITNSQVLQDCINRSFSAKYIAGKEELRIIMFK
jgi:hypothetical protein